MAEMWRKVFREGFLPSLKTEHLVALREVLASDDPRLIQGATTSPPPLQCVQDWPAEAGCLIGFCGIIENGGFGEATVGQAEEWFFQAATQIDSRMGETAAIRWLTNWWDETDRMTAINEILPEIDRAIALKIGA